MVRTIGALAVGAALLAAASAGTAKKPQPVERPESFEALIKCRGIADDRARLQCFDAATAALQQASDRHELVVVDKKQMRETRRTLFGLEIPRLKIFGGGDDDAEEVRSIESTVVNAYTNENGQWVVRLEDGSTWVQTDHNTIAITPRKGTKVKVVKAALGSYMMRIGNEPGLRARRQL
ncbi:MAG: hypothetical protein JO013_04570 [Alphaproteobacteria bacterium]|nr:hypothetical protein [Alphaproteobacteria bacterium]